MKPQETTYTNKICFLDCETTGLDIERERITQLAWVICDLDSQTVLDATMRYVYDDTYPLITGEIEELTGITPLLLLRYGRPPSKVFAEFLDSVTDYNVTYLSAHNGKRFDFPLLKNEMSRAGLPYPDKQELDTTIHIDYPRRIKSKNLVGLCAEHGIIFPTAHDALYDTQALKELFFKYDWRQTADNMSTPRKCIHINTPYDHREVASKLGYNWDKPSKRWLKEVKESSVSDEIEKAKPFHVTVVG